MRRATLANSERLGFERMMRTSVRSMSPGVSHADYHAPNIPGLVKKGKGLVDIGPSVDSRKPELLYRLFVGLSAIAYMLFKTIAGVFFR